MRLFLFFEIVRKLVVMGEKNIAKTAGFSLSQKEISHTDKSGKASANRVNPVSINFTDGDGMLLLYQISKARHLDINRVLREAFSQ